MKKSTHELKVDDAYFQALKSGEKNFEIRRDDRGFQRGDMLVLHRYGKTKRGLTCYLDAKNNGSNNAANAESLHMRVKWILTGGQFGLEPGYVAMAITPV